MRAISLPLQVEFMEITHYGEEREKSIDVIRDVMTELKGRHVIIVEDIVDTGLTLRYLMEHLQAKGPASLRVCTMLDKSVRRMADIPLDYVGFEVPDEFVIGYGLDYGGRYRNLPYIGVLQPTEPKAVASGRAKQIEWRMERVPLHPLGLRVGGPRLRESVTPTRWPSKP